MGALHNTWSPRMGIFIPTRNRPQNIEDLLFACKETNFDFHNHRIYIVVDSDDDYLNDYHDAVSGWSVSMKVFERDGKGMAKPLNKAIKESGRWHKYLMFMGDDHRPRTENWDLKIVEALSELGTGLVYPNDLLQGKNLATSVAMTANIAEAMDWAMVPPNMIHLYLDNFWMQLGRDLNALKYLDDVVLEHLHPVAGKAEWDEGYKAVNSEEVYSADAKAFDAYIKGEEYQNLLAALR
jgi:hypothetical protein